MFMESCNINNYINSLFYGVDLQTIFPKMEIATIYKNKYKRLGENTSKDGICLIDEAYMIINNLITILKTHYPKYLNNERILLFKNFYNQEKYDKLVFNSIISLSFIELETDNDDIWDDILTNIYYFCGEYSNYIYDDSKDVNKILTISIPVTDCFNNDSIPDITNYNLSVVIPYYDMVEDIPIIDNSIKDIFSSELKYLINNNSINKDKLFTELLDNCINLNIYEKTIDDIRNICKEIMSYITKDNLYLIPHLQFRILEKIFNNNLYSDIDFESILIKKITTIISMDIEVYNKSLDIDYENLKLLLLTYNYCIITIQDMIDKLSNDLNGKKISMFTYKSQIFKSRNKIQERIDKYERNE